MFDPNQLANLAVLALSPYLIEAAKGAAGKAGEEAYESSKKLLSTLRNKLFKRDTKVLARLEADPTNPENLAEVRISLANILKNEPSFQEELEALLQATHALDGSQKLFQSGNGNIGVQTAGKNNTTIIKH
jgi:hypothetical protein